MLNRPSDQGDALTQDDEEINGPYPTIDARPVWQRHIAKITAGVGAAVLLAAGLIPLGPGAFAIEPGQGLIRLGVDYDLAIDLAEHCERPVYMGQVQDDEYRITYEVARTLKSETDRVQVTVGGLQVGDVFNARRNFYGVWASDACPARLNDELLYN